MEEKFKLDLFALYMSIISKATSWFNFSVAMYGYLTSKIIWKELLLIGTSPWPSISERTLDKRGVGPTPP
jgi:hypothetical protein